MQRKWQRPGQRHAAAQRPVRGAVYVRYRYTLDDELAAGAALAELGCGGRGGAARARDERDDGPLTRGGQAESEPERTVCVWAGSRVRRSSLHSLARCVSIWYICFTNR